MVDLVVKALFPSGFDVALVAAEGLMTPERQRQGIAEAAVRYVPPATKKAIISKFMRDNQRKALAARLS